MKYHYVHKRSRITVSLLVGLVIFLLFWGQSGLLIWQSARSVCYHYLRHHHEGAPVTIALDRTEAVSAIVWVKKDEVVYKGRMFDIETSRETDSGIVLTGHFDGKEDKLFMFLQDLLEDRTGEKNGEYKWAFWFCEALMPSAFAVRMELPFPGNELFARDVSILSFRSEDDLSPPPEHCII